MLKSLVSRSAQGLRWLLGKGGSFAPLLSLRERYSELCDSSHCHCSTAGYVCMCVCVCVCVSFKRQEVELLKIPYEQAKHAILSLMADTYGKLSDDFVRFLWMLANSASTNSRLSQPSSQDFANSSPDSFAPRVGSSFSHIRVRVRAAVAKAAAARFMPDSADNGLLVPVQIFLEQANSTDDLDLPLPTIFLCSINRVSVSLAFLCVCACSLMFCLCFCSFMLSRVFSTPSTV
jgi:hypothetical protein